MSLQVFIKFPDCKSKIFYPRYFKYGAIGALIGHELALALETVGRVSIFVLTDHSISDNFSVRDGGRFGELTANSTRRLFEKRECFVRQYSYYELY